MSLLINCVDPFGNSIVLREGRYLSHISGRHEGFTLDDIQIAVESPDLITRDPNDVLLNLYYRTDRYDPAIEPEILKVCVRFRSDTGEITTAYLARGAKEDEVVLWKRR